MLETINFSKLRTEFGSAPISEKVAAGENARGPGIPQTTPLNAVRLPAVALDQLGLVIDVNTAAEAIFDDDIKIKDRRLFVRDTEAGAVLEAAIDNLKTPPRLRALAAEPVVVRLEDKLPVIVRLWPCRIVADWPAQDVCAILTLNALGPKPGPPAALLAKIFRFTPSEAKLACIIARGASPHIAAKERNISRETARNHLKGIASHIATHWKFEGQNLGGKKFITSMISAFTDTEERKVNAACRRFFKS